MSEPRTWKADIPPEPDDVMRVRDIDGDVWVRDMPGWRLVGGTRLEDWETIASLYSPLTEVTD